MRIIYKDEKTVVSPTKANGQPEDIEYWRSEITAAVNDLLKDKKQDITMTSEDSQVLEIPILNTEYCVYVLINYEDAEGFLQSHFEDELIELPDSNRGSCFWREKYNPVIIMHIKPDDSHFWATLTHEATHAIDHIWQMVNENSYGEIYSHSVGAVVAGVEQYVKEHHD